MVTSFFAVKLADILPWPLSNDEYQLELMDQQAKGASAASVTGMISSPTETYELVFHLLKTTQRREWQIEDLVIDEFSIVENSRFFLDPVENSRSFLDPEVGVKTSFTDLMEKLKSQIKSKLQMKLEQACAQ